MRIHFAKEWPIAFHVFGVPGLHALDPDVGRGIPPRFSSIPSFRRGKKSADADSRGNLQCRAMTAYGDLAMSHLDFDRVSQKIQLFDHFNVALTAPFAAFNLVDSRSRGPWPDGTYRYQGYNAHAEVADPDSEYGRHGILVFAVPGRSGMGVHSGRARIPDGLGRVGPQHCTLGCVRTTDEAMAAFVEAARRDPIESITVRTEAGVRPALVKGAGNRRIAAAVRTTTEKRQRRKTRSRQ